MNTILLGYVSGTKKKLLAAPGEVVNDADHPPIPVDQFGKHVTKMHKSDDRGFMIEYNASTGIVLFTLPALPVLLILSLRSPLLLLSLSLPLVPYSPNSSSFINPLIPLKRWWPFLSLFMQKLDSGQEYSSDAALLPESKAKNRYGNIIACKNNLRCLLCFYHDWQWIDWRIFRCLRKYWCEFHAE